MANLPPHEFERPRALHLETLPARPPLTPADVAQMRARVHVALSQAQAQSTASGKPLLILVGEIHYSPDAVLLESIIYQEARKLGVKDVALELPNNADIKQVISKTPLTRSTLMGMLVTHQQAQYFGANIHYVDDKFMVAINAMNASKMDKNDPAHIAERNVPIAANLAAISQPTIMITGAGHLSGLLDHMRNFATHEVVSFDVSDYKNMPQVKAKTPAKTIALQWAGDARALSTEQLFTMGMGPEEASNYLTWAEANGHKPRTKELTQSIAKSAETLRNDPRNTHALETRGNALYELGRDREAGKVFAQLKAACDMAPLSSGVALKGGVAKQMLDNTAIECKVLSGSIEYKAFIHSAAFNTAFNAEADRISPPPPRIKMTSVSMAVALPVSVRAEPQPTPTTHHQQPTPTPEEKKGFGGLLHTAIEGFSGLNNPLNHITPPDFNNRDRRR